jgi:hypothetical protein
MFCKELSLSNHKDEFLNISYEGNEQTSIAASIFRCKFPTPEKDPLLNANISLAVQRVTIHELTDLPAPLQIRQSVKPVSVLILPSAQNTHFVPPSAKT